MLLSDFKDKTRPHSCHVPRHAEDGEETHATMHKFSLFFLKNKYIYITLATIWLLAVFSFNPNWWFLKTCDFFRVKRQIVNSPPPGVYVSVMLHQNSFRVDTVLDGFGIEESTDFALLEKWPVFHWHSPSVNRQTKCCLIVWTRCNKSLCKFWGLCCEQVEDKDYRRPEVWNVWFNIGYTSRPIVYLDCDHMYDSEFSL